MGTSVWIDILFDPIKICWYTPKLDTNGELRNIVVVSGVSGGSGVSGAGHCPRCDRE